jgi:hypothetical protein
MTGPFVNPVHPLSKEQFLMDKVLENLRFLWNNFLHVHPYGPFEEAPWRSKRNPS